MRIVEQIQQQPLPLPANVGILGAIQVLGVWLEAINPILQAVSFAAGIAWVLFQFWVAWKKKTWKKDGK